MSTLILLWIASHLLAAMLYFLPARRYVSLCLLLLVLPIYLQGEFVGDIRNSYILGVSDLEGYGFEIGFYLLVRAGQGLALSNEQIIYAIQFLFSILYFFVFLRFKDSSERSNLVVLAYVLLSTAFYLGSQNVIRQAIASVLILWSLHAYINKKYFVFLILAAVAQSFHFSSILFSAASVIGLESIKYIIPVAASGGYSEYDLRFTFRSPGAIKILVGTIILVSMILIFVTLFPDVLYIANRNNQRFEGFWKVSAIAILFFSTGYFWSKGRLDYTTLALVRIRILMFSIFVGLSIFPHLIEVASRVLYFYFVIEAVCGLRFLSGNSSSKQRLGTILLLVVYGVSLNVLTLVGQVGQVG